MTEGEGFRLFIEYAGKGYNSFPKHHDLEVFMRLSVIIPVYNAEKTLSRCIDSLLEQIDEETEIVLVNDGSQDGSGAICEGYARDFQNIKYISQQNNGVSAARNTGLDEARGEFVLFVDSDDYVTPELFPAIKSFVNDKNVDLVQFSFCFDNGTTKNECVLKRQMVDTREELVPHIMNSICMKTINGPVAKMYRRDIIETNQIRFPLGVSVGEDRAFNIVYSLFVNSFASTDTIVYIINTENENSLSRKKQDDLEEQLSKAEDYIVQKMAASTISDWERECYCEALNYCNSVDIYREAKLMLKDHEGWIARQKKLMKRCKNINAQHRKYPKERYCTLTILPIRLYLTPVIDAIAWKLNRRP